VSESDILGPNDDFSAIENFASFERAMFEDYSFKNRIKILLLYTPISPHCDTYLKHYERCTCQIQEWYNFISTLVVN